MPLIGENLSQVVGHCGAAVDIADLFPDLQALVIVLLGLLPIPFIIVIYPEIVVNPCLPGKVLCLLVDAKALPAILDSLIDISQVSMNCSQEIVAMSLLIEVTH